MQGDRNVGSKVEVGQTAPNFTLPDQDGRMVSLGQLRAQGPLVLYFYPKDATPGCTAEACAFRDSHEVFAGTGARVVGVSSDSPGSHRRFADRHRLPFTLLADPGGRVRSLYGVSRSMGLFDGRVTFVIDGSGVVRHSYSNQVKAARHAEEALTVVRKLVGVDGRPSAASAG
jgi:thioredoxin-dependent peroxiredoxin